MITKRISFVWKMCGNIFTSALKLRKHVFVILGETFASKWIRTQCQDEFRNLSGCVIKILTGGRILQISIAWCQIEAEIRSFPTMYGKGGGICGKNWRNKGFRPKVMPKTRFFWGHKSGSSHFRVAWGPLFQWWCQFRYVPQKIWVKSFQMSYGHVR